MSTAKRRNDRYTILHLHLNHHSSHTFLLPMKGNSKPRATSIGPASTPDIHLSPPAPPLQISELSTALLRSQSQSRLSGTSAEAGEVVQEDTEEKDEMNDEMWCWGVGMMTFSSVCFVLGVWSIAIGPFLDTRGLVVSEFKHQGSLRERSF